MMTKTNTATKKTETATCPMCGNPSEYIEMADGSQIEGLCYDCADSQPEDSNWGDAPEHGYDW